MEIVTTTRASRNVFRSSLACGQPWQALNPMANPPSAPRRPHVISAHGDDREDPWFWLREREDPEVTAYLEAENAYTDEATAPLAEPPERPLRGDEGQDQRDRHVGARPDGDRGGTTRAPRRGRTTASTAGAPPAASRSCRRPESRARRSRSCSTRTCSPRARTTSPSAVPRSATTITGWPSRPTTSATRSTSCSSGRSTPGIAGASESVPETGYGLAWSAEADCVFYVRMDEAQRPFQLWRHRLGSDPAGDVLVFEEPDRRFSLGTGSTRDTAFVLIGLHSTNTSEWLAIPSFGPAGRAPRRPAPPRGSGVRRRPPHARCGRHRLVHRPDQRGGPGLPGPGRSGRRAGSSDRGDRLARGDPAPAGDPH